MWDCLFCTADPTGEPNTRSDVASGTCRFGDYEYNVGSTWNPRLETQGVVFCVTCRCFPGTGLSGRMNCTSQECPVVRCTGDPSTDLCCRICKETQSSGGGGSSRKSPPPSATAPGGGGPLMLPPPGAAPAEGPSCLHGGRQYREGQRFSSNLTILRPTGPEQCVQCQCQAGVVMCDVISCERPTCRQPVTTPDNCCPQCPAIAPTSQASSGPAVLNPASSEYQNLLPVYFGNPETSVKNKRGKSCLSGGRQYMEGEAWHPVIGPLGPMLCVLCQCRSSRIECSRFRCPEPSQMPCAKPERPPGQCCEMCPSPTPAHTLALQPPQPIPHLRGTHQSSYIASAAADSSPQQSPSSPSLCLPPGADLLTYRARGPVLAPSTNNETELLQYAFSQQSPGDVELHAWRLARGAIVSFQTRHVAAQDFRHLVLQFRFTPLGATTSSKARGQVRTPREEAATSVSSELRSQTGAAPANVAAQAGGGAQRMSTWGNHTLTLNCHFPCKLM
ncbi:hypothetical protein B566_EDAN011296 [Ephemera danica]|nr:hypothetical protein B566_EDAN011296 [Ephemera danica]